MRRRLGLVALAVAGLIVIAFSIPLAVLVRELARDRALAGAERDAQLIAVVATSAGGDPTVIRNIIGDGEINGNEATVILSDGSIIGEGLQEGEDIQPVLDGSAGRRPLLGGEAVYVPAIDVNGQISVVRIFVEDPALTQGVGRAWLLLALLGVALVGIAAVIASRLARSIVEPVEALSEAAEQLGAGDLSTRVAPAGPPEIQEVASEFNRLAEQITILLESERETAADLSHRLRTPLAALSLDAERLPDGSEREQVLDDVAELQRAVDFVIREVRRPERHDVDASADVGSVVRERMAFWDALADEQGRASSMDLPPGPGPTVPVGQPDLEAAVDALIGNVFSHTNEGVAYAVSCTSGDPVCLYVDDAGPGFGQAALERGRSGGGSTGLGLDIARRTVETTGGSFAVDSSPLGGARVTLTFGRNAQGTG